MTPSLGVSMDKWRTAVAAWALVAVVALLPAVAGAQTGNAVRDIEVVGAQRVDPDTVRSYMRVRPGDALGPRSINDALKSLFETGYFSDVNIDMRGDVLVVTVVENPIVNRIAFEGNRRIDDETLGPEVQLKPRQIFTRSAAERDVRRILEIYRRSGRFAASVEAQLIELPQNRVDVAFEIEEGEQTLIEKIVFIGNREFGDSELTSEISSKEAAWYRFLSNDDVYDPDRVAFDREQLRGFYLSQGYVDFRVVSAVAELTPDRDGFILTFTVEEGPQYAFGAISLENRLANIPNFRLSPLLKPRPGEIYDRELVRETVDNLVDEVGTFGFAFVDVRPRSTIRREDREVDLVFEVDEGPRVYVERIDIEGNLRTLDRVIRREFGIVEGDAFNTSKIARATRRVRNLGYFRKVDVSNEQGSRSDRARVKVEVEEISTGEFSIGAGYSSDSGALLSISLSERNLLGKGQELSLAANVSEQHNEVELSFTEPFFQDRPLSVGGDLFRVTREDDDTVVEDQETTGGRLRIGYRLSENWSQRWRYTIRQRDTKRRDFVRDISTTESVIGHELAYDTRDNRFNPTTGNVLNLSNDLAGLGGDARFLRTDVRASQYFPVSKRSSVTLALSARAGAIVGLGRDVGFSDRYFLGGRSLRGFDFGGIGPRRKRGEDNVPEFALGGNYLATATTEVIFPVGLSSEDLGLQARLFAEFGTLFNIDTGLDSKLYYDNSSIRGSLGFGISWGTPLGPLRLDFAWPVLKEDFDKDQTILFSIGTQF